jgi:hypothetical protein
MDHSQLTSLAVDAAATSTPVTKAYFTCPQLRQSISSGPKWPRLKHLPSLLSLVSLPKINAQTIEPRRDDVGIMISEVCVNEVRHVRGVHDQN